MDKQISAPGLVLLAIGFMIWITLVIAPNFWGLFFFDSFVLAVGLAILGGILFVTGADRPANSTLNKKRLTEGFIFVAFSYPIFFVIERNIGSNTPPFLGWTIYIPLLLFVFGCFLVYSANTKVRNSNNNSILV